MKGILYPHAFYLLRTPLLPYAFLTEVTTEKLRILCTDSSVQEAIWLASPEFHGVLLQWLTQDNLPPKEQKKIIHTAAKYLFRMVHRSTPFGRFAGVATGKWTPETSIKLDTLKSHTRLDIAYLCTLTAQLDRLPEIRNQLLFYPNTTIYKISDQLRYIEYTLQRNQRVYELVHVEASEYLEPLLQYARRGATVADLSAVLINQGISQEDALEFLHSVIDNQLLVSELECNLTGTYYFSSILDTLQKRNIVHPVVSALQQADSLLTSLNEGKTPLSVEACKQVLSVVGPEVADLPLQVDTRFTTSANQLSIRIMDALQKALVFLKKIQPDGSSPSLQQFKKAFQERYEDRFMPLMEVLDPETGIGYGSAQTLQTSDLLAHIPLQRPSASNHTYTWSAWQQFLLEKYHECISAQHTEIHLHAAEIDRFFPQGQEKALPPSLYSICSVLAGSAEEVDQGNFQIYHKGSSGPSVAQLLSRFCYLDECLHEHVKHALEAEQRHYPDAVLAEIVHLNQIKAGNIAVRPTLRAYEIPIAVRTGVDEAHTIYLNDLQVGIRDNTVILYSSKLGKEVIPRLGTAHNYHFRSLPQYRFLGDLQTQHTLTTLHWDWGMLQNASFLPRVMYGKVILSPAQWTWSMEETVRFKNIPTDQLPEIVQTIRKQKNIPRFVTIAEYDSELPIDLENPFLLEVLQEHCRHQTQITLKENLWQDSNLFVQGPNGSHTHELIIPWYSIPNKSVRTYTPPPKHAVTRSFHIGSEWLYFKVYTGIKTTDRLLREVIEPLTTQLLADGTIDSWFFIRYNTPGPHLRIRFHGKGSFFATVITQLHQALQPYLEDGLLSSIQTDTYHRELERYGADTIAESEHLFYYDSVAVARILTGLEEEDEKLRWLLVMKGIDMLLDDFGYTLSQKKELLERLHKASKKEFNTQHPGIKKALATKYRREKAVITELMEGILSGKKAQTVQVFIQRSQHLKPVIAVIFQKCDTQNLSVDSLITSYLHLFANRMFDTQPRKQEMIVYDFLFQYYTSKLARERKDKQP